MGNIRKLKDKDKRYSLLPSSLLDKNLIFITTRNTISQEER